ncbi:MAG: RNA-binding S4 domain-containing protein [Oceanicaulis sp.]|uniref:S4 domain-containing protein n=1 Tax=Glycocaulis sp. TaxID=1969725 RepID=UPI0025BD4506|nr:S4 domain-containing protein [Glycocaulis sp.]MCC5980784.1 RNA-binding S4 domain-containing protein [Oceanicaulis sp.]MCH8521028.1 RNA-binding S4 domain-containing protein [Glycocaulis sp.]
MSEARQRVDVWLFQARFLKSRALAARFVSDGQVRLERAGLISRLEKPAHPVQPGDILSFAHGGLICRVEIRALGVRRGPAAEARLLYELR